MLRRARQASAQARSPGSGPAAAALGPGGGPQLAPGPAGTCAGSCGRQAGGGAVQRGAAHPVAARVVEADQRQRVPAARRLLCCCGGGQRPHPGVGRVALAVPVPEESGVQVEGRDLGWAGAGGVCAGLPLRPPLPGAPAGGRLSCWLRSAGGPAAPEPLRAAPAGLLGAGPSLTTAPCSTMCRCAPSRLPDSCTSSRLPLRQQAPASGGERRPAARRLPPCPLPAAAAPPGGSRQHAAAVPQAHPPAAWAPTHLGSESQGSSPAAHCSAGRSASW